MSAALTGKTVLVTGASSGIGRATAELLGSEGAHVYLHGRQRAPLEASQTAIVAAGGAATIETFDLHELDRLQAFIDRAREETGRFDVLVNNAGVAFPGRLLDGNPDDWRTMLETNVLALLVASQAAVRAMQAAGTPGFIINISSIAALRRDSGVYGATKHAVNVITATLREELERTSIRVASVMPGAVGTNFIRNYSAEQLSSILGGGPLPFAHETGQKVPDAVMVGVQQQLREMVCRPEDIAATVLFILSQPPSVNVSELVVRPPIALDVQV